MDPAVQRILDLGGPLTAQIHELLLDLYPTAVLTADSENIGYGASTGYRGLKFTVAPFDNYVRLGIAGGASLPDPTGLLQGTGKVHRHIKIPTEDELADPALHTPAQVRPWLTPFSQLRARRRCTTSTETGGITAIMRGDYRA